MRQFYHFIKSTNQNTQNFSDKDVIMSYFCMPLARDYFDSEILWMHEDSQALSHS